MNPELRQEAESIVRKTQSKNKIYKRKIMVYLVNEVTTCKGSAIGAVIPPVTVYSFGFV